MIVPGLHRTLSHLAVNDDEEQIMDHLEADDTSRQVATKFQGSLVKNVGPLEWLLSRRNTVSVEAAGHGDIMFRVPNQVLRALVKPLSLHSVYVFLIVSSWINGKTAPAVSK
ncbi:hypothetical protein IFM5058_08599 [Aspergillus udagawae]|nr:hypothetical protein IFM5058_08599 [Aspergillus udagawae]